MSERAKVSVYSDGADWYITETDGMATESTTAEVLLHEEVAALRQKADALAEALESARDLDMGDTMQMPLEDWERIQAALAAYRNAPSLHDSERKEPSERMQRDCGVQGEGEGV